MTPFLALYNYTTFGIRTPYNGAFAYTSPQAQDTPEHRHDGAKATDDRARRLLLEINLAMED